MLFFLLLEFLIGIKQPVASSAVSSPSLVEEKGNTVATSYIPVLSAVVANPSLSHAPAGPAEFTMDSFLITALSNPRDRMTILKLDYELERFIRDQRYSQFESMRPLPFFQANPCVIIIYIGSVVWIFHQ